MDILEFIIQIISAAIGSLGFSLLFNSGKRNLIPATIGGALCWLNYMLCIEMGIGVFVAAVIAAAAVQSYSEIFARVMKSPATVFYIPSIIPLVPGGSLYYTMYYAAISDWADFRFYGWQTLQVALGIAVGTSFVSALLLFLKRNEKA